MARCVDDTQTDAAEHDLVSVCERLERVLRLCRRVDRYRSAVVEGETAVPGNMVGVVVRLQNAVDAHVTVLGLLEVLLDRVGGVDDQGDAVLLVADEVGRTTEVVVEELLEEHGG